MFPFYRTGMKKFEEGKKLPYKSVTEEEFTKLCIENGMTEEKAKLQAGICKVLGSYIQLKDQNIMIREEE